MNPLQARYPEAFEYLRARGIEPSADFYDRVEAARKQAWTMSKLSDLEHIGRIKASLEKAIAEGMSFDNWRKENLADLQGLPKSYQETVFRTTVLSSYNAGRWAHFRDHAERRPILRYTAIKDSRTRPAHRALHGLMMPVDDPRGQTLAPPGGFNCRCTLMSLSERQAKGMGYTGAPQDIPTWTDKHGVEHTAAPDKGWNHSPEYDLTDYLRQKEQKVGLGRAVYNKTMDKTSLANDLHKAAESAEPQITELLLLAGSGIASFAGLENRLKTAASIEEKIRRTAERMGITEQEAAGFLDDTLRYTALLPVDAFVSQYLSMMRVLKAQGVEVVTIRNTWQPGTPYKGLHLYLRKDGVLFELQFHTQESYDLKQRLHAMYEEARMAETPKKRRNELLAEMRKQSKELTEPQGIGEIK